MVAAKAVGGRSLDIFERKEYGFITCVPGEEPWRGQFQSWATGWVWMLQTRTRCAEDNSLLFGSEIYH